MVKSILICLMVVASLQITALAQTSQNPGGSLVVTGRVLDVDGHPIDKAHVCAALILEHKEGGGQPPCASTDADGNFSIVLQQAGRYGLIATKYVMDI